MTCWAERKTTTKLLPAAIARLAPQGIEAAAARHLRADGLVFVVVGEADVVAPQLKSLGLPVEIRK